MKKKLLLSGVAYSSTAGLRNMTQAILLHTTKCSEMIHTRKKNASCCAKKSKASGELKSLNEQQGTYDDF